METKHTKGPWHTGGKDDRVIYAADGYAVGNANVFHSKHEGDEEANARLMAAAPELLEALQYARRFLKPVNHDTAYVDCILAKATKA